MRTTTRRDRGFVLLLVLVIIAILSVITTALYVEAESNTATARMVTSQQIAVGRAEFGLQTVIAQLRSANFGGLSIGTLVPCDLSLIGNDPFLCPSAIVTAPIDNGAGELMQGKGLQYRYVIFVRQLPAGFGTAPQGLLTVHVVGYYGFSLADFRLTTAEIEADIQPNRPPGVTCVGDNYECS